LRSGGSGSGKSLEAVVTRWLQALDVDRRELMTPLRLPDSAQKRVDVRGLARLANPSNHRR